MSAERTPDGGRLSGSDGMHTYRAPFLLVDGCVVVRVEWEDDDDGGVWVARLVDMEQGKRTVLYSPMAHGSTQEEALAHLAIAAYAGLIEDRNEPA